MGHGAGSALQAICVMGSDFTESRTILVFQNVHSPVHNKRCGADCGGAAIIE